MSSAANVSWDLNDLYASVDDLRIDKDLDAAHGRARAFETTYRGKVGADAASLLAAVTEYESLAEQMDRSGAYAGLLHAAKTDDPRHGALLAKTRERRTAINKHLIFFDLEWVKVGDDAVAGLGAGPGVGRFKHLFGDKKAGRAHYLSEAGGEGLGGEAGAGGGGGS